MVLTREDIRDGYVQRLVAHEQAGGAPLSEDQLNESRRQVLAEAVAGSAVWVIGYGSLMWNPAFHITESRIGTLFGYHRRFCLWSTMGRGSPDNPGLMLALTPGGCCQGLALRLAPEAVESETDILWRREMVRGAYRPRWVRVHTPGGIVGAITFVINPRHDSYAGVLPEETVAARIAAACGRLGPCAEYLTNTVAHLQALGIRDRHMSGLLAKVRAQNPAPATTISESAA
jgi:cation transport protein ChaC